MTKEERCKQAFQRRFGKSMLPLSVKPIADGRILRVTDRETGTWADYDVTAWRVRRVHEHDEAA